MILGFNTNPSMKICCLPSFTCVSMIMVRGSLRPRNLLPVSSEQGLILAACAYVSFADLDSSLSAASKFSAAAKELKLHSEQYLQTMLARVTTTDNPKALS